tara:strand:- start:253 stop:453 length:201 start_codon:yes stop_codon:yes gene_type:complete
MQEQGIKNQTRLAEILEMDRTRVNAILNNRIAGKLNLTTVDRICKVLECQPGDILERVPDPETKLL